MERGGQKEREKESGQGRGWKFSVKNTEGAGICHPVQVFPAGILPNCYSSLCIMSFFFFLTFSYTEGYNIRKSEVCL